MKKIRFIHVGLGDYSLQRLQILLNNPKYEVSAFVDKNPKTINKLSSLKNLPLNYRKLFFTSINEACKQKDADACFIYVSSKIHARLIIESLLNKLHVLCVKSITFRSSEFIKIMKIKNKNKKLLLVQGLNNQWSDASLEMKKIIRDKKLFGEFLIGFCKIWARQNLKNKNGRVDTNSDGSFFHSMACHQLGQLVSTLGLPKSVFCKSPAMKNESLGYKKIARTSMATLIFDYGNNNYFTYIGNRAAHGNPDGFAARWSGEWFFSGTKSDLKRRGGRITLYSDGSIKKDTYHSDIDDYQIKDDERQFDTFYYSIIKKNREIERYSLNTWLLMEACNLSSKNNKTVNISELKKKLLYDF